MRSGREMPFGFPRLERVSNDALYNLFRNRPASFTLDEATRHTSNAQASKYAEEIVSPAYLRADGQLLTCEPARVLPMAQRYYLF